MITERERILKAKGYRHDSSAPTHDSAVMKASYFRKHGYFATVLVEWNCGIPSYSVWTKPKKGALK